MKIERETLIQLYQDLLLLRRAEEMLVEEYPKGTIRTPTHFGIGQEATAVGMCSALNSGDIVYTHHRSHNHYLAMGGNLTSFFAELFGREGGCAGGRGGSVHLIDRSVGFYGSSPILGHSIALATGGALAFSMNKTRNVAVAFFGEGVLDEGSVWESFNFAAIHKLPVIFVCENNLYATEAPMKVRKPLNVNICEKVKGFGINAHQIDGNNVELMFQESKIAIEKCLNGEGPIFIECMTYRWLEHVGPFNDNVMGRTYRSADELLEWKQRCPIKKIEKNLLEQDYLAEKEMGEIRKQIDEQLSESFKNALLSPWPKAKDLFDNVN